MSAVFNLNCPPPASQEHLKRRADLKPDLVRSPELVLLFIRRIRWVESESPSYKWLCPEFKKQSSGLDMI